MPRQSGGNISDRNIPSAKSRLDISERNTYHCQPTSGMKAKQAGEQGETFLEIVPWPQTVVCNVLLLDEDWFQLAFSLTTKLPACQTPTTGCDVKILGTSVHETTSLVGWNTPEANGGDCRKGQSERALHNAQKWKWNQAKLTVSRQNAAVWAHGSPVLILTPKSVVQAYSYEN